MAERERERGSVSNAELLNYTRSRRINRDSRAHTTQMHAHTRTQTHLYTRIHTHMRACHPFSHLKCEYLECPLPRVEDCIKVSSVCAEGCTVIKNIVGA